MRNGSLTLVAQLLATYFGNSHAAAAWSPGSTSSCTTNQDGRCIVLRSGIGRKTSSISFTVTGVVRPTYVYDYQQNHDPDANSNGTRITLVKP